MPDETSPTDLPSQPGQRGEPSPGGRRLLIVLATIVIALLAGLGFLGYGIRQRLHAVENQLASLSAKADDATNLSHQAMARAVTAEAAAQAAAEGRQQAEAETATAREEVDTARQEAASAQEAAAQARQAAARAEAEAERIRKEVELELNRLEQALSQVAETRRTALGLVMNLGSDYLKFDFDRAELRPENRELLSRIAGILLTSKDYSISINGHTDDVGTEAYNQKLSERRAEAVRDYLVKCGLPEEIFTVTGHGKRYPLVSGSSEEARAKNRRVELGVVNTRILYGRSGGVTADP